MGQQDKGHSLAGRCLLLIATLTVITKAQEKPPTFQCKGKDWTFNENYLTCYQVYESPLSWNKALETCKIDGGKLVTVVDWYQNLWLSKQAAGNAKVKASGAVWIGMNRLNCETKPTDDIAACWSDKQKASAYEGFFGPNEPAALTSKLECVKMDLKTNLWSYAHCEDTMPFICQLNACVKDQFQCINGKCLSKTLKCNGKDECGDASDENECPDKCRTLVTGESGRIDHLNYKENQYCQWIITGPAGSKMQIQFLSIETQDTSDVIEVYAGSKTLASSTFRLTISGKVAGTKLPKASSDNNVITITFTSDGSNQKSGFQANWKAVKMDPAAMALTATTDQKEIKSFGNPDNYNGVIDQVYTITTDNGKFITVNPSSPVLNKGDTVTFYDGLKPTDAPLAKWENTKAAPVTSLKNQLRVAIHTEAGTGLAAKYYQGCDFTIDISKNPTSTINFPGYTTPAKYPAGVVCSWLIQDPNTVKKSINLEFADFNLATGDYIQMFTDKEGKTKVDSNTEKYTSKPAKAINVAGGVLLIKLTTLTKGKGTATNAGFKATVESGCDKWDITPEHNLVVPPVQKYDKGSTLAITCKAPTKFEPIIFQKETGGITLTCSGGKWMYGTTNKVAVDVFRCVTKKCGLIPSVVGGEIESVTGMEEGKTFNYKCTIPGVTPKPSTPIPCEAGKWKDAENTKCESAACTPALASADGVTYKKEIDVTDKYGTYYTAKCEAKKILNGDPMSLCTYDEKEKKVKWSAKKKPTCQDIKCPKMFFEKGELPETGADSAGTPKCSDGYEIKTTATIKTATCGLDGKWPAKDKLPKCEDKDECAATPAKCTTTSTTKTDVQCINTPGSFTCKCKDPKKYELNAAGTQCVAIDKCARKTSGCTGTCTVKATDPKGYICECPAGQTLFKKDNTLGYKLPDGQDGKSPTHKYYIDHTCVKVKCLGLTATSIANGKLLTTKTDFFVGDKVKAVCNIGYAFKDAAANTWTCNKKAIWDPAELPKCIAQKCADPAAKTGERVTFTPATKIYYGKEVTVTCISSPTGITPEVKTVKKIKCQYDIKNQYKLQAYDISCPPLSCALPHPLRLVGVSAPTATTLKDKTKLVQGHEETFTCSSGFTKEGKNKADKDDKIKCDKDADGKLRWNFKSLYCKPSATSKSCPDPTTPFPYGEVSAISFMAGASVSFKCNKKGFLPKTPSSTCGGTTWAPATDGNMCQDVEKPVITNCPKEPTKVTLTVYDQINYPAPIATDNSGETPVLKPDTNVPPSGSRVVNKDIKGTTISVTTELLYAPFAKDAAAKTSDACKLMTIEKVIENTLPEFTAPTKSYEEKIEREGDSRTLNFDKPATADKEKMCTLKTADEAGVTVKYNPSTLTINRKMIGQNILVVATAEKKTNAGTVKSRCSFYVTVKGSICKTWMLGTPENGERCCKQSGTKTICTMRCKPGYIFHANAKTSFECTKTADWNVPATGVPNCFKATTEASYIQKVKLIYLVGTPLEAKCAGTYLADITTKMKDVVKEQASLCATALKGAKVEFGSVYQTEDKTAMKRTYYATIKLGPGTLKSADLKLKCGDVIETDLKAMKGSSSAKLQKLVSSSGSCKEIAITKQGTDLATVTTTEKEGCDSGTILSKDKSKCLPCPSGTYYKDGPTCEPCPVKQYQSKTGQTSCEACPTGKFTPATGSRKESDCITGCPVGMEIKAASEPEKGPPNCKLCDKGKYRSDLSKDTCTACPTDQGTIFDITGAISVTECKAKCAEGEWSVNGLAPCFKCPQGFYSDKDNKFKSCKACDTAKTTIKEGSKSDADCIDKDSKVDGAPCKDNPCQGPSKKGKCTILGRVRVCECPKGWYGLTCEKKVDVCNPTPCYNGGVCTEKTDATTGELSAVCTCPKRKKSTWTDTVDKQSLSGKKPSELPSRTYTDPASADACAKKCVEAACKAYSFKTKECNIYFSAIDAAKAVTASGYTTKVKVFAEEVAFSGDNCKTIKEGFKFCDSAICENGGQCQNLADGFRCYCAVGFYGSKCEQQISANQDICQSRSDLCINGGTCVGIYQTGNNDKAKAKEDAKKKIWFYCKCPTGYTGERCETEIDICVELPCMNDGTCVKSDPGKYTCTCPSGFTGDRCQYRPTPCSNNPCGKLGMCNEDLAKATATCVCKTGYKQGPAGSPSCVADDLCLTSPCQNGAACSSGTDGKAKCTCLPGWEGDTCEKMKDSCISSPCRNNGVCENTVDGYTCTCPSKYKGKTCEELNPALCNPNPCKYGGVCSADECSFKCDCIGTGFKGDTCSDPIDNCVKDAGKESCLNGGTCTDDVNKFVCKCVEGFEGQRCEKLKSKCADKALTKKCLDNGGKCYDLVNDYYCKCGAGVSGKDCEISNSAKTIKNYAPCQNGGTVVVEKGVIKCNCKPTFTGTSCELSVDPCDKTNGYCKFADECDAKLDKPCKTCTPGYSGDKCDTEIDECKVNHVKCQNDGKCIDMLDNYYCKCSSKWMGTNCETALDDNWDLKFMNTRANAWFKYPVDFKASEAFTVTLWVRFQKAADKGTILSLVGYSKEKDWGYKTDKKILFIKDSGVDLYCADAQTTALSITTTAKINNGKWNHVSVVWTKAGEMYLYVNGEKTDTKTSACAAKTFDDFANVVLGNTETDLTKKANGMTGLVSQVMLWKTGLKKEDLVNIYQKKTPKDGSILAWSTYKLNGPVVRINPSTKGVEPAEVNLPTVTGCPSNINKYSDGTSETAEKALAGLKEPSFKNVDTKTVTKSFGKTPATGPFPLGQYAGVFAARDKSGNYAFCTFLLYIAKKGSGNCETVPVAPGTGITVDSLKTSNSFAYTKMACPSGKLPMEPVPKYFTCGPVGYWTRKNAKDAQPYISKPFRLPNCGTSTDGVVKTTVKFKYPCTDKAAAEKAIKDEMVKEHGKKAMCLDKDRKVDAKCAATFKIDCTSRRRRRRKRATATSSVELNTKADADACSSITTAITSGTNGATVDSCTSTGNCADGYQYDATAKKCVECAAGYKMVTISNVNKCVKCPIGEYQPATKQKTCISCAGTTTVNEGSTAKEDCITACTAGQYYDLTNKKCVDCAKGTYQDTAGSQTSCKACPVGKSTSTTKSTKLDECKDVCPSGQELKVGVCTPCARGTYKTLGKSEACVKCPTGKTTTKTTGATADTDCDMDICKVGQMYDTTLKKCKDCDYDTFQNELIQTSCKPCPTNKGTDKMGSSTDTDCKFFCPAGQELDKKDPNVRVCNKCPRGKFKIDTAKADRFKACTECPATLTTSGEESKLATDCNIGKCTAGQEIDATDKKKCKDCPVDKYQTKELPLETDKCVPCQTGYGTAAAKSKLKTDCKRFCPSGQQLESDKCVNCKRDKYKDNDEGATSKFGTCKACPTGKVSQKEGAKKNTECSQAACDVGNYRDAATNACKKCAKGFYQDKPWQDACTKCTTDTTTVNEGSKSKEDCQRDCVAGKETNQAKTDCQDCPIGKYKTQGGVAPCTECPPEKVNEKVGSKLVTECTIVKCSAGRFKEGSTCKNCKKGTYQAKEGMTTCDQCPSGTTTLQEGSKQSSDCLPDCKSGSILNIATKSCEFCPIGTYRDKAASSENTCTKCSNDKTTRSTGSTSSVDCSIDKCKKGQYQSSSGSCIPCEQGEYNDKDDQTTCQKCDNGKFTDKEGSNSKSDCKDICDVKDYCKHGTCKRGTGCECKTGYQGNRCDQTESVSDENLGKIIGGAVGGVAAVLLLAGIAYLVVSSKSAAPAMPPQSFQPPTAFSPNYQGSTGGTGYPMPNPEEAFAPQPQMYYR